MSQSPVQDDEAHREDKGRTQMLSIREEEENGRWEERVESCMGLRGRRVRCPKGRQVLHVMTV